MSICKIPGNEHKLVRALPWRNLLQHAPWCLHQQEIPSLPNKGYHPNTMGTLEHETRSQCAPEYVSTPTKLTTTLHKTISRAHKAYSRELHRYCPDCSPTARLQKLREQDFLRAVPH